MLPPPLTRSLSAPVLDLSGEENVVGSKPPLIIRLPAPKNVGDRPSALDVHLPSPRPRPLQAPLSPVAGPAAEPGDLGVRVELACAGGETKEDEDRRSKEAEDAVGLRGPAPRGAPLPSVGAGKPSSESTSPSARLLDETDAIYVQLDGEAILLRNPISLSVRRRAQTAVLIPDDSTLVRSIERPS